MDTTTIKTWPNANEKGMGWTAEYPRPTEDNGHHPSAVATRQAEWDAAEEKRVKYAKRTDEIRARREAEEQATRDAAAAKADDKQRARREADKAMLRRHFIAAGGSSVEWEAEKDEVIREHRRRQVAGAETADDRARQESARRFRAQF